MYQDIIEVRVLGGTRLGLTFESGEHREVDIASIVPFDGVFEPLRSGAFFALVSVNHDLGTIMWPNGADLCPDVLYERSVPGSATAA